LLGGGVYWVKRIIEIVDIMEELADMRGKLYLLVEEKVDILVQEEVIIDLERRGTGMRFEP
jgi:hypothetical protein